MRKMKFDIYIFDAVRNDAHSSLEVNRSILFGLLLMVIRNAFNLLLIAGEWRYEK